MQNKSEILTEAAKVAPPVGVTLHTYFGYSTQEWVYILTILYTVIQIGWFIFSRIKGKK